MDKMPPWVIVILAILGGGGIGSGGMNVLNNPDKDLQDQVIFLERQIYNLQEADRQLFTRLGGCK